MPRVSPEDLLQLIYDEVNKAIRTTASLVIEGPLDLGVVELKDPVSGVRVNVKFDGTNNAAVITANVLPLPTGAATDAALQNIVTKLATVGLDAATLAALEEVGIKNFPADFPDAAAGTTLASILTKLATVGLDPLVVTDLKQVSVTNLPVDYPDAGVHTRLDTLNGKDFATELTVAAILAKLIANPATAPRQDTIIGLLGGGAREHRELTVATLYDALTNSTTFTVPKQHARIFTNEDVYWVDSAVSDADAGTKLAAANQRGFIRANDRLELSLRTPITRLDFLARQKSGLLYITGLE